MSFKTFSNKLFLDHKTNHDTHTHTQTLPIQDTPLHMLHLKGKDETINSTTDVIHVASHTVRRLSGTIVLSMAKHPIDIEVDH